MKLPPSLENAIRTVYPFTFANAVQAAFTITSFLVASACGSGVHSKAVLGQNLPPIGVPDFDGVVVQSRAIVEIRPGMGSTLTSFASSGSQPISVTNSASSSMSIDNAQWRAPTVSNAVLDFGFLNVTDVKDNNLKLCGTNGNQQCGTALIRVYTTGKPGAGLWNSADGYGMPIYAGLAGAVATTPVGLNTAGAVTLQSIPLPNSKHTVKYSDFSPTPHYSVLSDFTDAGAGSYSATLVIEYALAP